MAAGPGGTVNFNDQNQDVSPGIFVPLKVSLIVTTYYVMSGYYAAGNVMERWVTTNVHAAPPSGHTLQSIDVEGSWTISGYA